MEYLSLGKIIDAFGLDGTVKTYCTTSMGEKRYQKGAKVFLYDPKSNGRTEATVLNYRHNGLFDFIKLDLINSKEEAISKKGYEIQVVKNSDDLEENTYFYSDIEGCKVLDEKQKELGFVSKIEEFPAQITLRVTRKGKSDFFVPFIEVFIKKVDIKNKVIVINAMEGLYED